MMRTTAVLLAISLLVAVTAAQQRPTFEVASARVALDAIGFGGLLGPDGKDPIQFSNVVSEQRVHLVQSLYSLVQRALRLRAHQLVAPNWTNELWIEIRATIPPDATPQQVPEMLHGVLVERFGLKTHTEARTMDAYQLVVGPGGIRMREVEAVNDLEKEFEPALKPDGTPMRDTVTHTADGPVRTMSIFAGTRRITSRTLYESTADPRGSGVRTINATRMTMAELVSILTPNIGKPVVDGTGLNGVYQFTIELPRDEAANEIILRLRRAMAATRGLALSPADATRDSPPETARTLQAVERLGLRLERRRLPVDVVVVDSIQQQPSEN